MGRCGRTVVGVGVELAVVSGVGVLVVVVVVVVVDGADCDSWRRATVAARCALTLVVALTSARRVRTMDWRASTSVGRCLSNEDLVGEGGRTANTEDRPNAELVGEGGRGPATSTE